MSEKNRGKALPESTIKMVLRQYRMMQPSINWMELGRRCGIHASTAKRYVKKYLDSVKY